LRFYFTGYKSVVMPRLPRNHVRQARDNVLMPGAAGKACIDFI